MPSRILCIGDMHLGRRIGHIPAGLGLDARSLSPEEAWRRSVEFALREQVSAVALTGDLVDTDTGFFRSISPLESGIQSLAAAGIPVVAVAGNHDSEVLPRLARQIPELHLLGQSGEWSSYDLSDGAARFVGWSFTRAAARTSPLDGRLDKVRALSVEAPGPVIGLLHCDRDIPGSVNAPVTSSSLSDPCVDSWLLGHIHAPDSLAVMPRKAGYLGSLSPLDPTETGVHGPWLLTVDGKAITMEHLPLAPIRWDSADVSVTAGTPPEDVENLVADALTKRCMELDQELGAARVFGCRITVNGATRFLAEIRERCVAGAEELVLRQGDVDCFVDKISPGKLTVAHDLADLAQVSDPPGVLARMLMDIEQGTEQGRKLVKAAQPELAKETGKLNWRGAGTIDMEQRAAEALLEAGRLALDKMLAQRAAVGPFSEANS